MCDRCTGVRGETVLQVRATQNCRTEVLEHRRDQVLSKPRWDKKTSNHKVRKCKCRRSGGSTLTFYTASGEAGLVPSWSGIPKAACLNPVCSRASALFWSSEFPIPLPRVLGHVDFMYELSRVLCDHPFNSDWCCLTITTGQVAARQWLPSQQREPWEGSLGKRSRSSLLGF